MNRKPLCKQPHTTAVTHFSHDGRGIARIDGKTTFIDGALPGETVVFQYTRQKSDFDEGKTLSVLASSVARSTPKCSHYDVCGGCSLQHLNADNQIHEKQTLLLDSLQRIGHCQPESLLAPITGATWNYRNKARLAVKFVDKKQRALIGFREKANPRYIVEMNECPILHPLIEQHLETLKGLIESFERKYAITQVEVAAGDNAVALIFRNLEPLTALDSEKLRQFAINTGFWVYLQPGNADTVQCFYPETGADYLTYQLAEQGVHFQFHPTDFTQINAEVNQKMITQALDLLALTGDDVVLDLFCGLGNFSLPIAKRCQAVVGIEGSDTMVQRASMNARLNAIDNAEFFCANLDHEDGLKAIKSRRFNKLLLDPPRTGALAIVQQMPSLRPDRIVYVSCNPATLARDANILVNQQHYQFKAAGVMDMFPQTAHVESIALFERDS